MTVRERIRLALDEAPPGPLTVLWMRTQTGRTVTVTNASDNGTLAPGGGATSVGLVGAHSGPNFLSVAFTLNGTVCSAGRSACR